jgi:Arc/MetJ family transcription regulator
MSKTLIDIEDALLVQVREILGVTTKKDAVNGALREIVRQHAAAEFIKRARGAVFGPITARARANRS